MQLCRFRFSSFMLLLHHISLSGALPSAIARLDTVDFTEESAYIPYAPGADSILPTESILVAGIVLLTLCIFGGLISLLQFARSYCRTRRTMLYLNSPVYLDPLHIQLFVEDVYAAPAPPYCPPPPSYQDKCGPQKAGWLPVDGVARGMVPPSGRGSDESS